MTQKASFAYSTQGFSHLKKENDAENILKRRFPCQDRSFSSFFESQSESSEQEIDFFVKDSSCSASKIRKTVLLKKHETAFSVLAVSDGHGSAPYFRSEMGAEFAIISLVELLTENIDRMTTCYSNSEFNQIEKGLSVGIANNRWLGKISEHLLTNPITELEYANLSSDLGEMCKCAGIYKKAWNDFFKCREERLKFIRASVLKQIYGCTLIAYIETTDFWFALQIGDGDFAISYDGISFQKPIPEDPRCNGNETTSLCEDKSYESFRFAHGKKIPKIVFCSSDGVSNSVKNDKDLFNLYNFIFTRFYDFEFPDCINCTKNISKENYFCDFGCRIDLTKKKIFDEIYSISKRGSGDDISIAGSITFELTDIEKVSKYTFLRYAQKIEFSDSIVANSFYEKAAQLGNPEIIYEKTKDRLQKFCKKLETERQLIPSEKEELLQAIKQIGKQQKELLDDMFLALSKYYIYGLVHSDKYEKASIDEVLYYSEQSSNSELKKQSDCLKLEVKSFVENKMLKEICFNENDFSIVLGYSVNEQEAYDFLYELVKLQLERGIVQEKAIALANSYFEKQKPDNESAKKLLVLYLLLLDNFIETGEDICKCVSFFDRDYYSVDNRTEYGDALYRLYCYFLSHDYVKAYNYLERGAYKYKNMHCLFFLGKDIFNNAFELFGKEQLQEAKPLFIKAREIFAEICNSNDIEIKKSVEEMMFKITEYIKVVENFENAIRGKSI